jgi:hypothetical protein
MVLFSVFRLKVLISTMLSNLQVSTSDEKCEERLAELAGERAKKAEQREEREARAEERRRAIKEERQRQIDAMIERRREREERIQGCQAAAR